MPQDPEKKQKVLHTRVPASLEKELKSKAARLGTSVSNLVRNVLTNALDLVEEVVADSARIADSAQALLGHEVNYTPAAPEPEAIVAWQEAILGQNALCVDCNAILARGTRASIALTQSGRPGPTLCLPCLGALAEKSQPENSEEPK